MDLKTEINFHNKIPGFYGINPLNAELNPICHLPALAGARHFVHVRRIRVNEANIILYGQTTG
jgi:hypothetical protein